jgi:O-antigen/teichoic acid export membrane protein
MAKFTKQNVGKGAAYMYIYTIIGMTSGYIFWLAISRISTSEVIGVAGAVVSLASILTTITSLGVPVGIERFLGRTVANRKVEDTKIYVKASLYLLAASLLCCTIAILLLQKDLYVLTRVNFGYGLLAASMMLTISSSLSTVFRGIIISTLKTKSLALASIASTTAKIVLVLLLLFIGVGPLNVTIGITSFTILETIILGFDIRTLFREKSNQRSEIVITKAFKTLLTSGMPSYVPGIIAAMGSQLGTLLVFGLQGAGHAGSYYLAYSIYFALYTGMSVIFSITFPVMSSLDSGHKDFAWRITKISILAAAPLSFAIMIYSTSVMRIFGNGYVNGAIPMEVLFLSMVPVAITYGVSNLAYSLGAYRQVMVIGIVTNLPRTILYFVLVPYFGEIGAAISFTVGSFAGFILSIAISKKYEMTIVWKYILVIIVVSVGLSYLMYLLHIHFVIGTIVTLILSYAIYFKLRVLLRSDIEDSLTVLPSSISKPTQRILDLVDKKMNVS